MAAVHTCLARDRGASSVRLESLGRVRRDDAEAGLEPRLDPCDTAIARVDLLVAEPSEFREQATVVRSERDCCLGDRVADGVGDTRTGVHEFAFQVGRRET